MATIIDKTVSGTSTNSYIDPQDAADYFQLISSAKFDQWVAGASLVQARIDILEPFCIGATKVVNDHFDFTILGDGRTVNAQKMPWPQKSVPVDGIFDSLAHPLHHHNHHFGISDLRHGVHQVDPHLVHLLQLDGTIAGGTQFLASDEHPEFVIEATSEMALVMVLLFEEDEEASLFDISDTQGILLEKVDVLTTQFSDPTQFLNLAEGVIKGQAWIKLQKFGKYIQNITTPGFGGNVGIS